MELLILVLVGLIQLVNVGVVIVVLCVLDKLVLCVVWVVGIVVVCILGCLQVFECGGVQICVDVGYNLQVVGQLVCVLKVEVLVGCILVVYVVLQDKDVVGVVQVLQGVVVEWIFVGLDGLCGQSVVQLQVCLVEIVVGSVQLVVLVEQVLVQVLVWVECGDCVLVFGFFYIVVIVLQWLQGSV